MPPQGMQAPFPSGGPAARSLSEAERLAKVNTGVTFVFYGIVAFFAAMIMGFVSGLHIHLYFLHYVEQVLSFVGKVAIVIGCVFTLYATPRS